jgi:WhiB family redox-sensing transcriptional regulator
MNYAGGALVEAPWWESSGSTPPPAALPCHRVDPEVFFAEAPADVEAAKVLCLDCPVREACLAGALERREPWGVWGGELFIGGVVVARKRPRGRPRKHPVAEPFAPVARLTAGKEAAA